MVYADVFPKTRTDAHACNERVRILYDLHLIALACDRKHLEHREQTAFRQRANRS
jgi:hypothetical protein